MRRPPARIIVRSAAVGVVMLFALALVPRLFDVPCRFIPSPFRAAAQLRICGGCYCYSGAERDRCEAEDRAAYERAHPPRGQIEGVCWAFRQRRLSGSNSTERVEPIFSKVRYNETRTDGFFEIRKPWRDLVVARGGETDGFRWISDCAAPGNPMWSAFQNGLQQELTFVRVFLPTYGIADTPEERALAAKEQAAAAAAEAARKREADRLEAERQAKVRAIAAQLGPGRQAAAERLQKMNEEVAALRPKRPGPATPPPKTPDPQKMTAFVVCYLYGQYSDGSGKQWQFYISQIGQMQSGTGEAWPNSPKDRISQVWGNYLRTRGAEVDKFARMQNPSFPTCHGFKTAAEAQENKAVWLRDVRGGKGGYAIREENWSPKG